MFTRLKTRITAVRVFAITAMVFALPPANALAYLRGRS
jgi:hypothetical protein